MENLPQKSNMYTLKIPRPECPKNVDWWSAHTKGRKERQIDFGLKKWIQAVWDIGIHLGLAGVKFWVISLLLYFQF